MNTYQILNKEQLVSTIQSFLSTLEKKDDLEAEIEKQIAQLQALAKADYANFPSLENQYLEDLCVPMISPKFTLNLTEFKVLTEITKHHVSSLCGHNYLHKEEQEIELNLHALEYMKVFPTHEILKADAEILSIYLSIYQPDQFSFNKTNTYNIENDSYIAVPLIVTALANMLYRLLGEDKYLVILKPFFEYETEFFTAKGTDLYSGDINYCSLELSFKDPKYAQLISEYLKCKVVN